MDELMKKVVEKLNLSIDKAPEIYEGLKKQYIIYNTCNTILEISTYFIIASFIVFLVFADDEAFSNKNLKLIGIGLTVIFIIGIGVLIFRNINTPDIVFLKGMMER